MVYIILKKNLRHAYWTSLCRHSSAEAREQSLERRANSFFIVSEKSVTLNTYKIISQIRDILLARLSLAW